jgi:hypothetical protein
MNLDLARRPLLAVLLAAGCMLGGGCAVTADDDAANDADGVGASTDEITDVNHSKVKRQSIGNCWIYATASWAESLNKSASASGKAELNMSESYWTYWHWYEQVANGNAGDEISTGGFFDTSAELINRYGIMTEGKFIASESQDEMSARQKSALEKMNASLKTGALSKSDARRDRALVRKELDAAWELTPGVRSQLTRVFGASVQRTLDKSTISTSLTSIRRANTIKVSLRDPDTHQPITATLQDAIGTQSSFGSRTGRLAWQTASYPTSPTARRAMQVRVQKAMHDRQPVVVSWYVDFNALDDQGRFFAPPSVAGRQGGHMVVVEDYQINNVPGFGTLAAGTLETRPAALEAALSPAAKIEFIRIKNSWGSFRSDRQFVVPGYHDLYMKYLDGPTKQCVPNADDTGSTDDCHMDQALNDFVMPAGY